MHGDVVKMQEMIVYLRSVGGTVGWGCDMVCVKVTLAVYSKTCALSGSTGLCYVYAMGVRRAL